MQRVTRTELCKLIPEWDAIAAMDPGLDPFCARSPWQLAFHDAFEPDRPLWHASCDDGFVVLAESQRSSALGLLEPLENAWGFGSPLIGPGSVALLGRALLESPRPVLLLSVPAGRLQRDSLTELIADGFGIRALEPTTRFVASLDGGLDGWLKRRTRSFRQGLRAATRRTSAAGITFRRVVSPLVENLEAYYDTVLDIERRSWKGRAGIGANRDPMRSFYHGMWRALAKREQLRLLLAEREGAPVGYLHGGAVNDHFRGLQFSFDEAWRALGLGNVLQLEMLRWLCEDGTRSYDLGGQSAYKARWGEVGPRSLNLLIEPPS